MTDRPKFDWMSTDKFIYEVKGTYKVGQRVKVFNRGGVGFRDSRNYQYVTKVTKTQVTLDNECTYMIATGAVREARARCDKGRSSSAIIEVRVEA